MDRLYKLFIISIIIFFFLSGTVVGILVYLCHHDKKEYEHRIVIDDRGPALKDLERKALAR